MRKAKLVFVTALAAAAAGCGGSTGGDGDVLIIVPDYGSADVAVDSAVPGEDTSVGRDTAVVDSGSDAVDPADTFEDQATTDTSVAPDEGVDVVPDAGPRCSLGKEACNSGSADRKTCQTASVLGRITLATDNAITQNLNTLNSTDPDNPQNDNNDELDQKGCPIFGDGDLWCDSDCDDDGLDHFFRVYLIPGDYFSLSVSDYLVYDQLGSNIDFMLKVYRGNQCPTTRESLVTCINDKSSGRSNIEVLQIKPLTEAEAGWYTIVVDSIDEQNAGTYTLQARLFQNSEYTGDWSLCCDYPLE